MVTEKTNSFTLNRIKQHYAGHNISGPTGSNYPFRAKGYSMPTLGEVLVKFPSSKVSIDIKYKNSELADNTVKLVIDNDAEKRAVIGSFHGTITRFLRKKYPSINTYMTSAERSSIFFLKKFRSGVVRTGNLTASIPEYISFGRQKKFK
jgi:hypothetical protein